MLLGAKGMEGLEGGDRVGALRRELDGVPELDGAGGRETGADGRGAGGEAQWNLRLLQVALFPTSQVLGFPMR